MSSFLTQPPTRFSVGFRFHLRRSAIPPAAKPANKKDEGSGTAVIVDDP